jgi:hypothetical protein
MFTCGNGPSRFHQPRPFTMTFVTQSETFVSALLRFKLYYGVA